MTIETMKVKPWGEGQGDHVIINAEDFNPEFHQPFEAEKPKAAEPEAPPAPLGSQADAKPAEAEKPKAAGKR